MKMIGMIFAALMAAAAFTPAASAQSGAFAMLENEVAWHVQAELDALPGVTQVWVEARDGKIVCFGFLDRSAASDSQQIADAIGCRQWEKPPNWIREGVLILPTRS